MKCTTKGSDNFVGFLFQDDFSEETNLGSLIKLTLVNLWEVWFKYTQPIFISFLHASNSKTQFRFRNGSALDVWNR